MMVNEERGRLSEGASLTKEQQIELAQILTGKGYSNAAIAYILRIPENTVRELFGTEQEVEWGYNCLTTGIHHGRPEEIWNIPLMYAVKIYSRDELTELVIARIYNDAMQFVNYNGTDHSITTPEWAERVKEIAQERFLTSLQHKVGELSRYYNSTNWRTEVASVIEKTKKDKLNPHYSPLHPHDSINMLCRIIGTRASILASKE